MRTLLTVLTCLFLLPVAAEAQDGGDLEQLGAFGDWMAARYDDPFGENSGSIATNNSDTKRLGVYCYDNGVRAIGVTTSRYLIESSMEPVRWVVDDGEPQRAEWTYIDGGVGGTQLGVRRGTDRATYEQLINQFRSGESVLFRLEDGEDSYDLRFSLIGFTRAYNRACGGAS